MRVLVTGAGGLLGGRIAALLHARGHTVRAACRHNPPPDGLPAVSVDLTEPGRLEDLLEVESPDAVVHAAAAQAPRCRERPDEAREVNTRLPGRLGSLCRARDIRLVALSTDLVLDGQQALSAEDTPARPLSVYGKTKLAGEESLLRAFPAAAVVRVALVAGRGHGPRATASESVARALRSGRVVRLFTDEYRTPVDPESVTDAVARLLERPAAGRFHLGGPERLTRHALGLRTARALGLAPDGIEKALQADLAGPEPRAPDASLDTSRVRRELAWVPRPLDEALAESRVD